MNLSNLKPAEYNPRKITDKALSGLRFSLKEFGDLSGIVFNKATQSLVCGHQRVKSLIQEFGDIEIFEISEERGIFKTPEGDEFNVRFVNWELEKEKAANIAANIETIQGDWNESLSFVLDDIQLAFPEVAEQLYFADMPALSFPEEETVFVEKQDSEISAETRESIKFGGMTIFMSDEELNKLMAVYDEFIEKNRNSYGFVTYLLDGKK